MKLDEKPAVAQLREWLSPHRIAHEPEPATDLIRIRVFDADGQVVVGGYPITLPVDAIDLRTHANNMRERVGLPDLPSGEPGRGFLGSR